MLQNATHLRKSAPWPPNISDEHVFCTAPATENASLQILFKCPTPAIVFGNATRPSRVAHFWQGAQSLAPATRSDIWTSKSGPNPLVFLTFWFRNVQQRALFRHLNFRKWSEHGVLCTFWLRNMLRATTACTFSTSQLLKWSEHGVLCTFWLRNVLRATTACNFSSLIWSAGSAPAALASLLFDPAEPQIIGKTQCFAALLPFRSPRSSSSLLFFSLTLTTSAFHLSILSEVWLLNFLRLIYTHDACTHISH